MSDLYHISVYEYQRVSLRCLQDIEALYPGAQFTVTNVSIPMEPPSGLVDLPENGQAVHEYVTAADALGIDVDPDIRAIAQQWWVLRDKNHLALQKARNAKSTVKQVIRRILAEGARALREAP